MTMQLWHGQGIDRIVHDTDDVALMDLLIEFAGQASQVVEGARQILRKAIARKLDNRNESR